MYLYLVMDYSGSLPAPVALCLLETTADQVKAQGEHRVVRLVNVDYDLDFMEPLWVFLGIGEGSLWHAEVSAELSVVEHLFRKWTETEPPGPMATGRHAGTRVLQMEVLPPRDSAELRHETHVDLSDAAITPIYQTDDTVPYAYRLSALGFTVVEGTRDACRRQFMKLVRKGGYRWVDSEDPESEED